MTAATLVATGALCPLGGNPAQVSASVRADLSRCADSSILDAHYEPVRLSLVPAPMLMAPELPPLPAGLRPRTRRILRLASLALLQLAAPIAGVGQAVPLFLALPEPHPATGTMPVDDGFLELLALQTGLPLALSRSQRLDVGPAGGLIALERALQALGAGESHVIVGGADTFVDLRLLSTLGQEGRILGPRVSDGFIPGEGAAFLLLRRAADVAAGPHTCVRAAASVDDPGHRYGSAPALGEGLSDALSALFPQVSHPMPFRSCFGGLNGESLGAKPWGVARIRHATRFASDLTFDHPIDTFGDPGAAIGPLLLCLADETLRAGQRQSPALVFACSDGPPCAAAYVELS